MTAVLFVGVVISLGLTEVTGYSPGGIIAAGYLAMFAAQPVWLAGTMAAALLTYGLVRLFEQRLLLYGRRQFAVYILSGILISQLLMRLSMRHDMAGLSLLVVGYLVPGLIARDFARQGIAATVLITALAVILTQLAALAGEGLLW